MNKIICSEALQAMKKYEDNEFDLVLTDPPYGIGESNEKNLTRGKEAEPTDYGDYDWDEERLDKEYFDEMRRISKNQIIFGGNYYTDYLYPSSCWIIWNKNITGDFADCEMAWASFDRSTEHIEHTWNGMIRQDNEERFHPTQKPVRVFRLILEKFADEDDKVLDPFLGSGTTAVACKQLGLDFVGIEKKQDYVDIARSRISKQSERLTSFTSQKSL